MSASILHQIPHETEDIMPFTHIYIFSGRNGQVGRDYIMLHVRYSPHHASIDGQLVDFARLRALNEHGGLNVKRTFLTWPKWDKCSVWQQTDAWWRAVWQQGLQYQGGSLSSYKEKQQNNFLKNFTQILNSRILPNL